MNQLTMTTYTPAFGCGQAQGIAVLNGPRELTEAEIDSVNGGIAPLVIAGAKIAGAAFLTGFGAAVGHEAGVAAWNGLASIWGEEEAACR